MGFTKAYLFLSITNSVSEQGVHFLVSQKLRSSPDIMANHFSKMISGYFSPFWFLSLVDAA